MRAFLSTVLNNLAKVPTSAIFHYDKQASSCLHFVQYCIYLYHRSQYIVTFEYSMFPKEKNNAIIIFGSK